MSLISPGTQVTIIDESQGASSGPGTIPLIIAPTRENKTTQSGDSIAEGTTQAAVNDLFLISSQRELLQTFGIPVFKSVGGSQMHGHELNEYGLLAAHSFLGVSNRAFVLRPDIDLGALESRVVPPTNDPEDGTYWLDLSETEVGLFEYDTGSEDWELVEDLLVIFEENRLETDGTPKSSVNASEGDYAIVPGQFDQGENKIWYRGASSWESVEVGFDSGRDVQFASHINVPEERSDSDPLQDGDVMIRTTRPANGSFFSFYRFNGDTGSFEVREAPLYATRDDATQQLSLDGALSGGDLFVHYNPDDAADNVAEHNVMVHNGLGETVAVGSPGATVTAADQLVVNGTTVTLSGTDVDSVATDINNENISGISAEVTGDDELVIIQEDGLDITLADDTGTPTADLGFGAAPVVFSNWENLGYVADIEEPLEPANDGDVWYKDGFDVDILINNGTGDWDELEDENIELFVQSAEPTAANTNDLWIDTTDVNNFPALYRFDGNNFVVLDKSDQNTKNGVVFGDARSEPSDVLDADAPNANLYPKGILLYNTRYSSQNVKEWREDYEVSGQLVGDRWVTVSGTRDNGIPFFGRDAVREVVVQSIVESVSVNDDIRSVTANFNLISCPGFPEVTSALLELNTDRKNTAFVIGDTPFELNPTSTSLRNWVLNEEGATRDGKEGLTTADEHVAFYYPSGFTSNIDGQQVVVPASHMALRTYARNDQVAYPWFAPAGYQRGTVDNANSVGYVNQDGEFVTVELNEGQKDTLYENNVNPIEAIPGRGLVIMGQKTRNPDDSALGRVNVVRLTNYIRRQADAIAKPYLFRQNDTITRKSINRAYESFFAELVTLRGVTDFVVQSDESNNTPARRSRNELWVDIAFIPTEAVEFIYVPVRIRGAGDDLEL